MARDLLDNLKSNSATDDEVHLQQSSAHTNTTSQPRPVAPAAIRQRPVSDQVLLTSPIHASPAPASNQHHSRARASIATPTTGNSFGAGTTNVTNSIIIVDDDYDSSKHRAPYDSQQQQQTIIREPPLARHASSSSSTLSSATLAEEFLLERVQDLVKRIDELDPPSGYTYDEESNELVVLCSQYSKAKLPAEEKANAKASLGIAKQKLQAKLEQSLQESRAAMETERGTDAYDSSQADGPQSDSAAAGGQQMMMLTRKANVDAKRQAELESRAEKLIKNVEETTIQLEENMAKIQILTELLEKVGEYAAETTDNVIEMTAAIAKSSDTAKEQESRIQKTGSEIKQKKRKKVKRAFCIGGLLFVIIVIAIICGLIYYSDKQTSAVTKRR